MIEFFVTEYIASTLMEIGFDEPCLAYYHERCPENDRLGISGKLQITHQFVNRDISSHKDLSSNDFIIPAPLVQQVLEWFAEKYKIEFSSSVGYDNAVGHDDDYDKLWRTFNIIILDGGPLPLDVIFFEDKIYDKSRMEVIKEYFIPEVLKLITK